MWLTCGTETRRYYIKLENQRGTRPAVKDLIIANTINSLIVFNVCYSTLPPILRLCFSAVLKYGWELRYMHVHNRG